MRIKTAGVCARQRPPSRRAHEGCPGLFCASQAITFAHFLLRVLGHATAAVHVLFNVLAKKRGEKSVARGIRSIFFSGRWRPSTSIRWHAPMESTPAIRSPAHASSPVVKHAPETCARPVAAGRHDGLISSSRWVPARRLGSSPFDSTAHRSRQILITAGA